MDRGNVLAIVAVRGLLAHIQRLESFLQLTQQRYREISVVGVFENHNNEKEAYRHIRSLLARGIDLHGVYPSAYAAFPRHWVSRDLPARRVSFVSTFFQKRSDLLSCTMCMPTGPVQPGVRNCENSLRVRCWGEKTGYPDRSYEDGHRPSRERRLIGAATGGSGITLTRTRTPNEACRPVVIQRKKQNATPASGCFGLHEGVIRLCSSGQSA